MIWVYLVIAFALIKLVDLISPVTGYVMGVFSVAGIAGYLFASFITKRFKSTHKFLEGFVWFNILAGLLAPLLGIFVASVTFGYTQNIELKNKRKLYVLIIAGVMISVVNYILATAYIPKIESFFENLDKKGEERSLYREYQQFKSSDPEKDFDAIFNNK